METIASFSTLAEAHLKRSMLESCGIEAFIPDENTAQMNWMYIGAMGGIRLQVPEESAKEAAEILNLDFEHEKGIMECPNCGSSNVRAMELSPWNAILLILSIFVPIPSQKIHCLDCTKKFSIKAAADNGSLR